MKIGVVGLPNVGKSTLFNAITEAGAESAKNGNDVTIIEKKTRCASKVRITGKGRCNVTNACFDLEELVSNVVTNPRFLYSAFSNFMPYDTIEFLKKMGVETKIERGGRVFPVSDCAADVADALVRYAVESGAKIKNGRAVGFNMENGLIKAVVLENGDKVQCDCAAVCTGGKSYPSTGSTGDGYRLAISAGHTIEKIRPCLSSLVCINDFIPELQGLSLKNVAVRLLRNGKTVYSDFGEMLFTHYGVSGPVILSASSHIKNSDDAEYTVVIDLKPALDEKMLDKRILRDFQDNINRNFNHSLYALLPRKLIPVIVEKSGIEPFAKVNEIDRKSRLRLGKVIKNFEINVKELYDIDAAIVTGGGVNVREIEPKTMKSRLVDNLYFAGEVIDVDAYTGGFNLQIAFSTGVLCGQSM